MAGIKYTLQKELFDEEDERILSVCTVSDAYKKKKTTSSYLLLVANTKTPRSQVQIVQVKQYESSVYKKKRSWSIEEVRSVDARGGVGSEFDLVLEKEYSWFAPNQHERQNFICMLRKQLKKTGPSEGPEIFLNIPSAWLASGDRGIDEDFDVARSGQTRAVLDDTVDAFEEVHALTELEELQLGNLMSECNFAIKDAEHLIDQLMVNLADMDGANVQSVLASEIQVNALMTQIETAITEAEGMEARLDSYDTVLYHIRETMEKMGEKNAMISIANSNNHRLLGELEVLVQQLDLPYQHQKALTEPDLTSQVGLDAAVAAAKALQSCINAEIGPDLQRLAAVQEQRKRMDKWKMKFSQTCSRHLNNMFIHLGNDVSHSTSSSDSHHELVLPKHTTVHKELAPFTELMCWLKDMDPKSFEKLGKIYTNSLSKIYDRDIRQFFDAARSQIHLDDLNVSVESGGKASSSKTPAIPYGVIGVNRDLWPPGIDSEERRKLDSLLERVLADLEPVALSEQQFCVTFFQMDATSPLALNKSTEDFLAVANETTASGSSSTPVGENVADGGLQRRIGKQINEEVRRMMTELFGCLETELTNFIQGFERRDSFYSMYVLVRLSQHVMSAQDARSFLSMTFASSLVQVKRNFDRYMQNQCQSVRDAKVPKRSKCGLLPYVENFEELAQTAERIFLKSERRVDLEKSYMRLIDTIFEMIPVHAADHPKTPRQVISMENFHRMHSQLAQLKVAALEGHKKTAKARYNEALAAYVTKYFGRPLEKLNLFFEGVQQKVQQGVKEQEISYQMAYSKQELRKVIGQYPAREVKKGLESLYKKVEKHLCEEENLLQVVWRAMQEEFIQQYNFLEERIQRCYAGAMITLEFNIQDILAFFSEIARSH